MKPGKQLTFTQCRMIVFDATGQDIVNLAYNEALQIVEEYPTFQRIKASLSIPARGDGGDKPTFK